MYHILVVHEGFALFPSGFLRSLPDQGKIIYASSRALCQDKVRAYFHRACLVDLADAVDEISVDRAVCIDRAQPYVADFPGFLRTGRRIDHILLLRAVPRQQELSVRIGCLRILIRRPIVCQSDTVSLDLSIRADDRICDLIASVCGRIHAVRNAHSAGRSRKLDRCSHDRRAVVRYGGVQPFDRAKVAQVKLAHLAPCASVIITVHKFVRSIEGHRGSLVRCRRLSPHNNRFPAAAYRHLRRHIRHCIVRQPQRFAPAAVLHD